MDKQEIFNHFSEIIDNLLDNSLYFETYFQYPWVLDQDIIGDDCEEVPSGISIRAGATRSCIVDDDYDYVVKFDTEEDEEGSACEREYQRYKRARENGLERYLAEPIYLGTYYRTIQFYDGNRIMEEINDFYGYDEDDFNSNFAKNEDNFGSIIPIQIAIPLYAYPKALPYDCGPVSPQEITVAQKVGSPLRSRNIAVATSFIREYGLDAYKAFSQFGIENQINDLHLGNVGEIDGHFALIDYAGYYSECDDDYFSEPWVLGEEDEDEFVQEEEESISY